MHASNGTSSENHDRIVEPKVEFGEEASLLHGEVINTRDVITFQGKSVAELKKAFRGSVDD